MVIGMDFELSEEQSDIQKAAREFAEGELRDIARDCAGSNEFQLQFVPEIVGAATDARLENVDQSLSTEQRMEESTKRIEEVLKDQLENK